MQIQLIETYREARAELEDAKKWAATYQEQLEKTEAYQLLEQAKVQVDIAKVELADAGDNLRRVALDSFEETGNKNPSAGLKIIINTKLHYKSTLAVIWASANAFQLLSLKKTAFEKEARQLLGTSQEIDFVSTTQEPSVRISKDL